ncbi:EthD domain-containing protein [Streptomyces carpinensis]|uniref:EthD domain-containing protein n=1 Tax=Streptomyces carpinensis TaxID=66369 RepID=A0ABV1WDX4_9ACTN|nr:EthD domain-containing protein [Streptomyces carpinensis]
MQHRIFLVPQRADLPWDIAQRHWQHQHGKVFAATPGLRTYVQNRPLTEPGHGRGVVCSETWYETRQAEQAAYASRYYRDVVTPDEAQFLDREGVWSARVTSGAVASEPTGDYRVLWFGRRPPESAQWSVLQLSRPVPGPGGGAFLYSTWTDDRGVAIDIAAGSGGLALACQPVQFPVTRATEDAS